MTGEIDVCSPPLVTVGGRVYRDIAANQHASRGWRGDDEDVHEAVPSRAAMYDGDEDDVDAAAAPGADVDEEAIDESDVFTDRDGFVSRVSCDPEVFPLLIGKEGRNKKQVSNWLSVSRLRDPWLQLELGYSGFSLQPCASIISPCKGDLTAIWDENSLRPSRPRPSDRASRST